MRIEKLTALTYVLSLCDHAALKLLGCALRSLLDTTFIRSSLRFIILDLQLWTILFGLLALILKQSRRCFGTRLCSTSAILYPPDHV